MKIVTINREYGSGGRRVAFMLSEKLGISCYDSNLLMVAGERYGINPDFPEGFDEQKSISLLYGISLIANNWADEDNIAKDVMIITSIQEKSGIKKKIMIFV